MIVFVDKISIKRNQNQGESRQEIFDLLRRFLHLYGKSEFIIHNFSINHFYFRLLNDIFVYNIDMANKIYNTPLDLFY